MADEIRAAKEGSDPDVAREQIERTRARMSETIDEIEDVLVRKKEQLQDRLDFMAPVKERPLPSLAIVFGAGLLLGLVTGGGDDAPEARSFDDEADARAEHWERRARRLLRIAREQEEELAALAGPRGRTFTEPWDDEPEMDRAGSSGEGFGDDLTERVTHLVTNAVRGLFGMGAGSR